MATWADIQSWELSHVEEAEDLIEAEVREAREIIAAHRDPGQAGLAPQRTHRVRAGDRGAAWIRESRSGKAEVCMGGRGGDRC